MVNTGSMAATSTQVFAIVIVVSNVWGSKAGPFYF